YKCRRRIKRLRAGRGSAPPRKTHRFHRKRAHLRQRQTRQPNLQTNPPCGADPPGLHPIRNLNGNTGHRALTLLLIICARKFARLTDATSTMKHPLAKQSQVRIAFSIWLLTLGSILCALFAGCASFTNPVANGVPVRLLPDELLA